MNLKYQTGLPPGLTPISPDPCEGRQSCKRRVVESKIGIIEALESGLHEKELTPARGGALAQVVTLAGSQRHGYTDGQGSLARFCDPMGAASDLAGGAIVADMSNHRVRKISPQGGVATLAGSGECVQTTSTSRPGTLSTPRDFGET
eukprot:637088-Prorocentrum_minimum.AAC.2